jgi:integrase
MAEISGNGYISKMGHNRWYMFLVIDGQKKRQPTGTENEAEAMEKLEQWKMEVKAGIKKATDLRYEKMRDDYLSSGKHVQQSILDDLNVFFKNMRLSAITTAKLKAFREFRESNKVVVEYKERSYRQEVALRKLQSKHTPLAQIEREARKWVENATKATTNRRLTSLRAMFHHFNKEEKRVDVPYFPMWEDVDNVRKGFVSEEIFEEILKEIPGVLHPYLRFLAATGWRSGQAAQLTWDMVSSDRSRLNVPAEITKTKDPQTLTLKNSKGEPFDWSAFIVKAPRFEGGKIFETADFRSQWRQACHKLKQGVYDAEKQTYRGLRPHDFRRTAISNMTAKGLDRGIVKSISGHKTDSMFNRYDIKDLRHQQNAFEVMEGK